MVGPSAAVRQVVRSFLGNHVTNSALTTIVMLALTVLASLAFGQAPALVDIGGALQRTAITAGFGWLTTLAIWTLARREWR